jgi:hypothetical protein
MADRMPVNTSPGVASLLGGIVGDLQMLMRQEIALAKAEVMREWEKAKAAASEMAAGAALLGAGILLLGLAVVSLLHETDALPWWASFLIVGSVVTVLGAVVYALGRNKAARVNVIPPQTAQTLRENVQWIRNQT